MFQERSCVYATEKNYNSESDRSQLLLRQNCWAEEANAICARYRWNVVLLSEMNPVNRLGGWSGPRVWRLFTISEVLGVCDNTASIEPQLSTAGMLSRVLL